MIKYILFLFLICFSVAAQTKLDKKPFESLINTYLKALASHDLEKLKEITSEPFYTVLTKNKLSKKSKVKEKYQFDLKVKKAGLTENRYLVSIKDKAHHHYGDYWYIIDKKEDKFIISEMRMIEE